MEHVSIHPETPQKRYIRRAAEVLEQQEGIVIYPTDTVYGVGCAVGNHKKIKEISQILHRDPDRKFSFLCRDISQANEYISISDRAFKMLKKYTPGPFTFILPASAFVKKRISKKRKYIGIRIPDHPVIQSLLNQLHSPIASISLNTAGENRGDPNLFMTPEVLNGVDLMLDSGPCEPPIPSTIIDMTQNQGEIIRQGKGQWNEH
jgi:tRNA threonylcarbamoyl adenosine modification protein (Sua5/YciO/YrdC/YwlC family)